MHLLSFTVIFRYNTKIRAYSQFEFTWISSIYLDPTYFNVHLPIVINLSRMITFYRSSFFARYLHRTSLVCSNINHTRVLLFVTMNLTATIHFGIRPFHQCRRWAFGCWSFFRQKLSKSAPRSRPEKHRLMRPANLFSISEALFNWF